LFKALLGAALVRAEGRSPHLIDPDTFTADLVGTAPASTEEANVALR
jgi:hypothetical protein